MTKRKNIAPKILAAESTAITQFLFDTTTPDRKAKLPLAVFFEGYQRWRKKNKLTPTALTIDGFGRLFPRTYTRDSSYWPPVKHALKCVFGVTWKDTA